MSRERLRGKFELEQTSAGAGASSSSIIYSRALVCRAASVSQGQQGDAGAARQARR